MDHPASDPEMLMRRLNGTTANHPFDYPRSPIRPKRRHCKYENVGERLAKRKQLFNRRRYVADVCLAVGLAGIALMLVHNELVLRNVYHNASAGAVLIKSALTIASIVLCGLVTWFNYVHYKLYMIDNTVDDWRLVFSFRKVLIFVTELVVCLIHPLPGNIEFPIVTPHNDEQSSDKSSKALMLSLDVVLSIPMFLRLYLFCRVLLLHSKLFSDVRSQSLGALNKAKFNFYFIFKSLMYLHPVYSLVLVVGCIFTINAWAMRLCEVDHRPLRSNYLTDLWLIAITFTSVGYGDLVPQTYCGRLISVMTGLLGAGCTALTCAVLAQKLELSRAEKSVNNFVIEMELTKARKTAAASIIANGWRVYRARVQSNGESAARTNHKRLLKSIAELQDIKKEQRKMADNQVTILELHRNQIAVSQSLDDLVGNQHGLEKKIEEIRQHMTSVENKL